ncbi:hypothetical protein EIN_221750 [Entamoeba invadens IP1]|uniref:Uncharacterized protein n=1 Tax=Entamoeba invadens IP1 TaxID=370355 RepID=A0A0A1U1Z1_ENTIV|nr:hypothetical protein EIN_221750 [Entamoeba invadens IP1]ELP88052.1 hypothetical protein EIN_221750 [Entamoeba invadens IP1]|eukprot:XP_004254823.1 hypothetical protein EIN_221750 [Entamoeba invadens IP1]
MPKLEVKAGLFKNFFAKHQGVKIEKEKKEAERHEQMKEKKALPKKMVVKCKKIPTKMSEDDEKLTSSSSEENSQKSSEESNNSDDNLSAEQKSEIEDNEESKESEESQSEKKNEDNEKSGTSATGKAENLPTAQSEFRAKKQQREKKDTKKFHQDGSDSEEYEAEDLYDGLDKEGDEDILRNELKNFIKKQADKGNTLDDRYDEEEEKDSKAIRKSSKKRKN